MKEKSKYAIRVAYAKGYRVSDSGTLTNGAGKVLKPSIYKTTGYPYFAVSLATSDPNSLRGAKAQHKILLHVFAAFCWFGEIARDSKRSA